MVKIPDQTGRPDADRHPPGADSCVWRKSNPVSYGFFRGTQCSKVHADSSWPKAS